MLRKFLDEKVEPLFKHGGKFEKFHPLYEANDTLIYTPGEVTKGSTHVRDAIDLKRMMSMVIVALIPCIFMACYNTGFQAQKVIHEMGSDFKVPEASGLMQSFWTGAWRYNFMDWLNVDYRAERSGFMDFGTILPCTVHGFLFFFPVWLVTMIVGGHCEVIFSIIRKHEINEGFLVTGMLFPLTLPPNIPLWQVALGIAFGVVLGKEIFGGTGKNFLNPALTARAFMYFAYPQQIVGNVWTAVQPDTITGATILSRVADKMNSESIEKVAQRIDYSWWDYFVGSVPGSMGETSTLCCLIGAAILILTRVGSWRIMAGVVVGMSVISTILYFIPNERQICHVLPQWHLVIGGFAFGTVFMATDPVSAAMTETGKWIYGFLIGAITVLVRSWNPAWPEGIMLAILLGNAFAPTIDYFVVQSNIKRRLAGYAA
jgi:Na+-transporting NADH:ubiquinone oxidoreductase subunit B